MGHPRLCAFFGETAAQQLTTSAQILLFAQTLSTPFVPGFQRRHFTARPLEKSRSLAGPRRCQKFGEPTGA
jgi:hypothetical protein